VIVAGWRTEHAGVSPEQTYVPYVGAAYHRAAVERLAAVEAQNAQLARMAAELATGAGSWEVLRMQRPFRPERGRCWTWSVPGHVAPGDSPAAGDSPTLVLEDGRILGPGHALHDDIRQGGGGRYSHWHAALYLSTSDNSDPNTNGRTYTAVCLRKP
jgi:hypothetical protein